MTENTTASGADDDSLLLCASDLQHSAIYDNPHEMVDCVRAVADRITALAASAPVAPTQPESLHTFLNAAAAEGYVLNGVDAADLYVELFPERYVAALEWFHSGMHEASAETAPVAPTQPVSITLDFKQATELLGMYGGEPTEVTLMVGNGHSGKGVYAHWTSVPEEEAMFLGASNDEAAPVAPAPQPVPQEWLSDQCGGDFDDMTAGQGYRKGWNDCRARMLAAAPKADHIEDGLAMVPAPLQQGEYLPLPEPAIKACHCYSTNQVREAIDADRAMRGAAQAAPTEPDHRAVALAAGAYTTAYSMLSHAEVHNADVAGSTKRLVAAINDLRSALGPSAPVAEDAANWHWLASYLVGPRTDLDDEIVASESVNDLRKLVSAARAQAAQPEGGAKT